MRPVWTGAISFGLVNIPVDLVSAESRNDLKFHMIDSRDQNRIRYERVNEETGEEVPWNQIVKAFEFADDQYVVVTDEDFQKADVKASKTIDIETFVDRAELDYKFFDKPYYIRPRKGGEKAYVLLREALKESDRVAISRVVIRTRAYLSGIYASKDALVLNLLRFNQELKAIEDISLPADADIKPRELKLALTLIEDMTETWDPAQYKDEYRAALMERIKAKAKGQGIDEVVAEEDKTSGKVIDIVDLLKRSVETKKKPASPSTRTSTKKTSTSKSSGTRKKKTS